MAMSLSDSSSSCLAQLKFDATQIYGRDTESKALNDLFQEGREKLEFTFVTLSGKAGSGKSTLVVSRRDAWRQTCPGLLYASGKYEQNRLSEPFSAISEALYDLVEQWMTTSTGKSKRQELCDVMQMDGQVLQHILPKIFEMGGIKDLAVGKEEETEWMRGLKEGQMGKCVRVAFCRLLAFLCSPELSIVLFLDDVQWADQMSLEILQVISSHAADRLPGLFLVAAYRQEEVEPGHALLNHLDKIQETCPIHPIAINDLSVAAVNQLVATVLKRDIDETLPLSQVVHLKTCGNPFFVTQFLRLLQEENLLNYSFTTFRWEWSDVQAIQREMNVSDNVADIIAVMMSRLPVEFQNALMIASCLGAAVPLPVLRAFFDMPTDTEESKVSQKEGKADYMPSMLSVDPNRLVEVLDSAVKVGILTTKICQQSKEGTVAYFWSHDKLQHVAYSLIPDYLRGHVHERLGNVLWRLSMSHPDEDWMVYMAAGQMNTAMEVLGRSALAGAWGVDLAKLNIRAARLYILKSAFYPAAEMLRAGVSQLDPQTRWEQHYNIWLELMTGLAEMEYATGNQEESMKISEEVLAHARTKEDVLHAQTQLLRCFSSGTTRDYIKGIDMSLDILQAHNIHLPRNPNRLQLRVEYWKLKRALTKNGQLENILKVSQAQDVTQIQLMEILTNRLSHFCFMFPGKRTLGCIASIRALIMACTHGISHSTPIAIFYLGKHIMGWKGHRKQACDYGDLAIKACDLFSEIPGGCHARVKTCVHTAIFPTARLFHSSLDPLLDANRIGLRTGDIEFASASAFSYCFTYLCVGLKLGPLEPDLVAFGQEARQFGMASSVQLVFQILRQTIMNLQETEVENPTLLKGEVMDQEEVLGRMEGRDRWMTLRDISTFRLMLSCIFGDLKTAEEMLVILDKYPTADHIVARGHLRRCYTGLAAFAVGHARGKKKHLNLGTKILKEVKEDVTQGSVNAHPILSLLVAEESRTQARYDEAIKLCARSGLIQHQAYMYERAGLALMEKKDDGGAEYYLSLAMELYEDFGALGKVFQLKDQYAVLALSSRAQWHSSGLKARSRHEKKHADHMKNFSGSLNSTT
jgi:predicted ATPase